MSDRTPPRISTLERLSRHWALLSKRQAWVGLGLMLAALVADCLLPPVVPDDTATAFWWFVAVILISAVVSYALAPKPPVPAKPTLEDFDMPTAEEGRAIPVVFGEVWTKGANVLWYGDLDTTPIKVKGGKK